VKDFGTSGAPFFGGREWALYPLNPVGLPLIPPVKKLIDSQFGD